MTEIPARFLESNKTIKHLEIPERITHIENMHLQILILKH